MADRHPGEIWREIIEEAGVTQVWVSTRIGVSPKHLNQVVQGHSLPSVKSTVAFANVMHVSAEKIWLAQALYELGIAQDEYEEAEEIEIPPSEKWS